MSFKLPPADSPIRELFDIDQVVAAGPPGGARQLPTMRDAISKGQATIAKSRGEIAALTYLILRADGHVCLHRVTAKSHKHVWDFGDPR